MRHALLLSASEPHLKTTIVERIGSWAGKPAFTDRFRGNQILCHSAHFTTVKLVSVSILGGGTKMLSAAPFRPSTTIPRVEPPLDRRTRQQISSEKPFLAKFLRVWELFSKSSHKKTTEKSKYPSRLSSYYSIFSESQYLRARNRPRRSPCSRRRYW